MQKLEEVNVKVLVLCKQSHKSSHLSSLWNIEWCLYFYRTIQSHPNTCHFASDLHYSVGTIIVNGREERVCFDLLLLLHLNSDLKT